MIYKVAIPAPFGSIWMQFSDNCHHHCLLEVSLSADRLNDSLVTESDENIRRFGTNQYLEYIRQYLVKPHPIPLEINYSHLGSAFQKKVWAQLLCIPIGYTRTYSDIAHHVETHPRAVGNACARNPWPIIIPCHRVVAKNGQGGFMHNQDGAAYIKKWLLNHENTSCA